jgi:hypothetical protein
MEHAQLVLAACVSVVRGVHGVPSPRQEGVAESHLGVAALLFSLETESKAHTPARCSHEGGVAAK